MLGLLGLHRLPSIWSATAFQDAMNSRVPTSGPCEASSRIGRHARSTSSIISPLFRVAASSSC
jgi:hypothetical protein